MAGAERAAQPGPLGEREQAPRGHQAVAADDQRAVVQRGVREEDVDEELDGGDGVDPDPGLDKIRQPDAPLQHDQRADLAGPQDAGRPGDVVDQADPRLAVEPVGRQTHERHPAPAQLLHHPAQLGLEEHQQRERQRERDAPQHPLQRVQLQRLADQVRGEQHAEAGDQLHGAGAPHQHQDLEHDQGDHQDIDQIPGPPERRQRQRHRAHSTSASRAFCVWSRFSASSRATDRGPSSTSPVISSPRCAGRQCVTTAWLGAPASRAALTW